MQNAAGGTAGDSDVAETSNEQGRIGRCDQEGSVRKSSVESICANDASWGSAHEQCFTWDRNTA